MSADSRNLRVIHEPKESAASHTKADGLFTLSTRGPLLRSPRTILSAITPRLVYLKVLLAVARCSGISMTVTKSEFLASPDNLRLIRSNANISRSRAPIARFTTTRS